MNRTNMKIPIIQNVLEESDALAHSNRALFDANKIFAINMMSSPGAGKTTLLVRTIEALQSRGRRCAVIEGDITTTLDSERLAHLSIPVVQANTGPFGGDCHVGSHLVHAGLKLLTIDDLDYVFIENIGNLVCPAEFYLGENVKIVVLSLPEGEDKPLKYPLMFRECHMCLINKVDLIPHLDVDTELLRGNINCINTELPTLFISGKTGEGIQDWIYWIEKRRESALTPAIDNQLSVA